MHSLIPAYKRLLRDTDAILDYSQKAVRDQKGVWFHDDVYVMNTDKALVDQRPRLRQSASRVRFKMQLMHHSDKALLG